MKRSTDGEGGREGCSAGQTEESRYKKFGKGIASVGAMITGSRAVGGIPDMDGEGERGWGTSRNGTASEAEASGSFKQAGV